MPQMMFSPCDPSQPTCSDVTVGLLQHIFGPVIDVLSRGVDPNTVQASSSLLASIFMYYNTGVLAVASLIISYVATVGAVNTANDGEAMGKQWSAVWTPLRIVSGGALLLPTASGYSFLQMFVLTLALWSIGFANGCLKIGMAYGLLKPDGIVSTSYQEGTYLGMRDFAKQYLAAAYCARAAASVYADPAATPLVQIDAKKPDRTVTTGSRTDYTYYLKDQNPVTNLAGGEPFCGTVTLTSYSLSGKYSDDSGTQAALDSLRVDLNGKKLKAAMDLMKDIDSWVATMPADITQSGWNLVQSKQFNTIVKAREDQIVTQIAGAMSGVASGTGGGVSQGTTAFMDSMTREGWAMAGGWYQRVGMLRSKLSTMTSETVGEVSKPSMSGLPSDARASLLISTVTTVPDAIIKKSESPANGYQKPSTPRPDDFASLLPSGNATDVNIGAMSTDLSRKLTDFVNGMLQGATNTMIGSSSDVDAVSRMKMTGDLLSSYRAALLMTKFSINTTMAAAKVVAGGVGAVQILGTKVDATNLLNGVATWLSDEITPALASMSEYLGYLAFYFSTLLPSLPYTIFMVTVVGWILGVLQTVIAAPLWAVMHMRPSQTFVGSDQQGYLLLLALFVRPALAVIGLFAAMLVADPVVDYIVKAFFAMRGDVVASTGWVGAVSQFFTLFWWFSIFGALLFPVLYMIYGLPQVLPDHVLSWINAGVADLGATGATSTMRGQLSPKADQAGRDVAMKLAGGEGGSRGGGGGGSGPRRINGERGGRMEEPVSAGEQGISPATTGASGGGSSGSAGSGGSSSRAEPMSAGDQGSSSTGASSTGSAPASRSLSNRLSDGLGVAVGRAATDGAMAVKDAAAGGASGFGGRLASNMKDAAMSAGSEGVAAFKDGADSRVASFKSEMAMRDALSGDVGATSMSGPQSTVSPQSDVSLSQGAASVPPTAQQAMPASEQSAPAPAATQEAMSTSAQSAPSALPPTSQSPRVRVSLDGDT